MKQTNPHLPCRRGDDATPKRRRRRRREFALQTAGYCLRSLSFFLASGCCGLSSYLGEEDCKPKESNTQPSRYQTRQSERERESRAASQERKEESKEEEEEKTKEGGKRSKWQLRRGSQTEIEGEEKVCPYPLQKESLALLSLQRAAELSQTTRKGKKDSTLYPPCLSRKREVHLLFPLFSCSAPPTAVKAETPRGWGRPPPAPMKKRASACASGIRRKLSAQNGGKGLLFFFL